MTETSRILNPPPTNTNKPAFLSSFHVKISLNLLSDEVMNLLILFLFSFYTTHALTDLDFNLIPIRRKAKSIENSTTSSQESTQHRPESKSEHYVVVPPLETRENPPEIRQERPPRPNSEDTSKTLFGQPPQSWDLGGNQPQKVTLGRQLVPAHFRNLKHGHISSNLRRSEGGDMYQKPPQEIAQNVQNAEFAQALTNNGFLENLAQNIQSYFENKQQNSNTGSSYGNKMGQQMPEDRSNFLNSMSNLFGVSSSSQSGYANNMFASQGPQGQGQMMAQLQGQGQEMMQNGMSQMQSQGQGMPQNGQPQQSGYPQGNSYSSYGPNQMPDQSQDLSQMQQNYGMPTQPQEMGQQPSVQVQINQGSMQQGQGGDMGQLMQGYGMPQGQMQGIDMGQMPQGMMPQGSMGQGVMPQGQNMLPQGQDLMSQSQILMPQSQSSYPQSQNMLPQGQPSYPQGQNLISGVETPQQGSSQMGSSQIDMSAQNYMPQSQSSYQMGNSVIDQQLSMPQVQPQQQVIKIDGCLACQLRRLCQPRQCCCQCTQPCQQTCGCQQFTPLPVKWVPAVQSPAPPSFSSSDNTNFWNNYASSIAQSNTNSNSDMFSTSLNSISDSSSNDAYANPYRFSSFPKQQNTFEFVNPFNGQKVVSFLNKKLKKSAA